ncbi:hypothetical protein ACTHOQ_05610 [Solibacillus silvestris]|uniref:hypothetical protein n=1 Tax=Solibacillus silvestris TaxID=76853 RepID=UPI003F803EC9
MKNLLDWILLNLPSQKLQHYWTGFKPVAFAIFDEKDVYLFNHPKCKQQRYVKFPKTEQFCACTCILYEDIPTAIVDAAIYDSMEDMYSLLVHESFHGFQYLFGESRLPNEFLGFSYPVDYRNIQLRIEERKKLYDAYFAQNSAEQHCHISEFIALREKRMELFQHYVEYENLIETIEGPAYFVEYRALMDVSMNSENIIKDYADLLADHESSNINIRKSCYSSGLFLCLLLDKVSADWQMDFTDSPLTLFQFFKERYGSCNSVIINMPDHCAEAAEIMAKAKEQKLDAFRKFDNSDGIKLTITGEIGLTGFDPMNITMLDNRAIHHHFLKIRIDDQEYFIEQPVSAMFDHHFTQANSIILFMRKWPIQNGNRFAVEGVGELRGTLVSKNSSSIHIVV